MQTPKTNLIALTLCLSALGCAKDLNSEKDTATTSEEEPSGDTGPGQEAASGRSIVSQSGHFHHEINKDGSVITSVVDASDTEEWQALDLETGLSTNEGWDLKFRRFFVQSNGGVSGDGGVKLARLDNTSFDEVTEVPMEGWSSDSEDTDADTDGLPNNVFNNGEDDWYDYDVETHTLSPKNATFIIESSEGNYFKLELLDYYDEAGSPAVIRFRWAELGGDGLLTVDENEPGDNEPGDNEPGDNEPDDNEPGEPDEPVDPDVDMPSFPAGSIEIDASSREDWIYLSVSDGIVDVTDPSQSEAWDLAFQRTSILTNGGTSGPGRGAARASDAAWGEMSESSTCGFVEDDIATSPIPGSVPSTANLELNGWYDYDSNTHAISAGERSYVVRTASGSFAKLRIWNWADGLYQLSLEAIETTFEPTRLELPATAAGEWLYLSMSECGLVEVSDPQLKTGWDISVSRYQITTNSGTSGPGTGGALAQVASEIGAPMSLPNGEFSIDVESGEPLSSHNEVLDGWYDYNPVTHALTPKDEVYWIRTTSGHLGLLEIEQYAEGALTLNLAFAGQRSSDWGGEL